MKLSDIPEDAVLVISCLTTTLPPAYCVQSAVSYCRVCCFAVWVSPQSQERIDAGAYLLCVPCAKALAKTNEVVFGNDPLTPAGIEFLGIGAQQPGLN